MTKIRGKDLPLAERSPWRNRMLKAEAELAKRQWQPIETMPKDNMTIVLCDRPAFRTYSVAVSMDSGSVVEPISGKVWTPTHWMPLPEAPK